MDNTSLHAWFTIVLASIVVRRHSRYQGCKGDIRISEAPLVGVLHAILTNTLQAMFCEQCSKLILPRFYEFNRLISSTLKKRRILQLLQENAKTITVGGECGTVAWVDLWRGIFLCDVLAESPVLQDIPLPLPARGNWGYLLKQYDPSYFRDVTISRDKGCIRYIEMEIHLLEELDTTPVSYIEWVRKDSRKRSIIHNSWNVIVWSMAILFGSWEEWQPDCQVDTKDITLDLNQCPSNLLTNVLLTIV